MSVTVDLNMKKLDALIKALRIKPPVIRVGILGGGERSGAGQKTMTNATVGAMHEFGTANTPMRSFLRVPLMDEMPKAMKTAKLGQSKTLKEVIATATIVPWCNQIAIVAEMVVLEGFETGGYGKWPPSNMSRKQNHQTLVETQQLRDSIVSQVVT